MYFLILRNLGDNYYSGKKSQIVILCNVLFVDFLCILIYHCTGAILQDTAIIVFVKYCQIPQQHHPYTQI